MVKFLHFHPITLAAFLIFTLALAKGGASERWGAALMIGDWAFSMFALKALGTVANGMSIVPTMPTLVLDFLFAAGLLGLALRYGKLWLGSAMILQSFMLAFHAVALSEDAPGFLIYVAAINIVTCLLLLSLLIGVAGAWRLRSRTRRLRSYADAEAIAA